MYRENIFHEILETAGNILYELKSYVRLLYVYILQSSKENLQNISCSSKRPEDSTAFRTPLSRKEEGK